MRSSTKQIFSPMRNFTPFLLVLSAMVALLVLSGMVAGTPFINPGAMKKNKSPPTNSGSAPPAEPYQRGCIQANKCRGSSPSEKGGRKLLSVPLNSSYTLDNMLKILRNVKAIIL